ncbi:uncharacterized protein LOC112681585 [Sipha flava]|uniref:Uncharacterized protein LOC112681585 n=2 Tax=Sipha flava TaxID=143950 RepID=A0A8B8FBA9_9HEMI|nr:uncharacterized protein LOC112681585 [Sipha flava]
MFDNASKRQDHFTIHYELLGSDVKLRCLTNGTDVKAYKWDFETGKHKTNSTIIGNNTINLSILGLEPADSKNYTCTPETDDAKNAKTNNSYRHYVIAVSNPVYEIRGTAVYKTSSSSVCTRENVEPVRKQLPNFVRAELCPEGSTRYACNIVIEPPKCAEDQCFSTGTISPRWVMKEYRGAKTLEIKLLVTFNEKAGFLNRIRTSRRGRNALCYQQALARILKVLAANLNKTLTVEIVSKFSLIDTHFESDRGRTKVKTFVACAPGFGIREVFCGACPPHHYSANVSADCLKCPKGFHQPVAGSNKCLKCPHPFASGCYMREVPSYIFYVTILVIFLVFGVFVASCLCCCREENEKNIRIIPRNIRRKFKRSKGYDLM